MRQKFKFYSQSEGKDCGPTCLKMIAKHYGKIISLDKIRNASETTREGSSLNGLGNASEKIGFRSLGVRINFKKLMSEAPLPAILHWENKHFVVLYAITKRKACIADPAHGLLNYTHKELVKRWIGPNSTFDTNEGIALLLEPTTAFYEQSEDEKKNKTFQYFSLYIKKYKSFFFQLIIGLIAVSSLQMIFPFLTQSIVDVGIKNQDLNFIYLILAAQLFVFAGKTSIEIIRSWIILHLGARINISLISDFFTKLMSLPINFFDTRLTGDIMQRINDHRRIEQLLTTTSLNTFFSVINLLILGFVLAIYHYNIFLIFFIGTALYFTWIILFMKRRKDLDYIRFSRVSAEQSKVIELISGMQEIKLHNAEQQKRWGWEHMQALIFRLEIKSLKLDQVQRVGSSFINELKNILITIFAATLVIKGELTLGMLLAISYIIGQLNGPVIQLLNFLQSFQDAKIAIERLSEINNKEDEEPKNSSKINKIDVTSSLAINNLYFKYTGVNDYVLKDINLHIPNNKVTAIVGASGSGKTTLMKLLIKYYEPNEGEILLKNLKLSTISQRTWRSRIGVVMQEGFIFNDTIYGNIAVGEDDFDLDRLIKAAEIANIKEYIENLPQAYNTKIGSEGIGMSTGQKQRLLIARAVYKNPDYIFFDEATSALDAHNERQIMENLQKFYLNRTVIIIAHRLSTVKNADQIVVMNNGTISEIGNHQSLIELKGNYYNLVKNQLDLEKLNNQSLESFY